GENLDIGWLTHEHTGVPVIIYAFGPNAVKFTGVHDNTEIPRIIGKILDLKNFPAIIK
ncbi:MAG: alkaline phosphatase, partial [Bacteroidetes bacterium]|nr:alkaline phosphatase [Bacteroidota bacterium]